MASRVAMFQRLRPSVGSFTARGKCGGAAAGSELGVLPRSSRHGASSGAQVPAGLIVVPAPSAPLMEIMAFALTYDAYRIHGGFSRVASMAQRARRKWEEGGVVPLRLSTARTALFFEQRRAHWVGIWGEGTDEERYARALLERIRQCSGSTVPA